MAIDDEAQDTESEKPAYRHSGTLLVVIGVVHCLFGVLFGATVLGRMGASGLWHSVLVDGSAGPALDSLFVDALKDVRHIDALQRFGLFWFMFAGLFWIGTGALCTWVIRITARPLPRWFALFVLAYGVSSSLILPISGCWTLLMLGCLLLHWSSPQQAPSR